jgi:O-antigen ligase
MAARPARFDLGLPAAGPSPITAIALAGALAAGLLMTSRPTLGVALVVALLYAPIVLINFELGLALWFPLVFIDYLGSLALGVHAAAVLIGVAWAGSLAAQRGSLRATLRPHDRLVALVAVFFVWITISLTWAETPSLGTKTLEVWLPAGVLFLMVLTRFTSPKHLRWLALAFIAGALLSVISGLSSSIDTGASALQTATQQEGRLQGGAGDPNVLAAGIVPAMVLAIALFAVARSTLERIGLGAALALLGVGLAATESRGGLLALGTAVLVAVVVAKGRRTAVIVITLMALGAGGAWLVNQPSALQRVTSFNGGGNGRSSLWRVGWAMAQDHPIVGVGFGNFTAESDKYVRRPTTLEFIDLIVENPHVTHNTYLQLWDETGLIGLGLFLAVCAASLRAALRSAARWEALGDNAMATLSQATFVAIVALMAASFFLTNGHDSRWWLLLAMGPALWGASLRAARTR